VYTYLSWIYWSQGDAVETLRASLKGFELDPENTRARYLCYNYINLAAGESALDCSTKSQVMKPMEKAFIRILLQLAAGDRGAAQAILDSTADFEDDGQDRHYAALYVGDFEQARPGFEKEYPGWFSGPVPDMLKDYQIDDAVDAALLLQQIGEDEPAEKLLRVALESISRLQRNHGANAFGFLDVKIYALLGQREQALAALEECADLEYLSGWPGLKFLPHYDSIRGDPRFTAALARLNAAAELAHKRAVSEGLL
jgi:tetratricopeptide (TPR) repeat protein